MAPDANMVNQTLLAGNVATRGTKRFGECPHQDIDGLGVDTVVIGNATSVRTQSADRVSLIDEEIELAWDQKPTKISQRKQWTYLVLLPELNDLRQVHHRSLHTVKTLNDNQDFLPWSVRLGLTLADDLPQ